MYGRPLLELLEKAFIHEDEVLDGRTIFIAIRMLSSRAAASSVWALAGEPSGSHRTKRQRMQRALSNSVTDGFVTVIHGTNGEAAK
jgi:hypothetical protein